MAMSMPRPKRRFFCLLPAPLCNLAEKFGENSAALAGG